VSRVPISAGLQARCRVEGQAREIAAGQFSAWAPVMLPLYELPERYRLIAELPLETDADEPKTATRFALELEELRDDVTTQALSLAKVIVSLEKEADLIEAHARLLTGKASARLRRAEQLRRWVQLQLEGAALTKVQDPLNTVWLQASPPSLRVVDEESVPPEFKRVTLRLPLSLVPSNLLGLVQTCDVDKATIHELIKRTGELPPGIEYQQGRKHLRIR
jgi:Siphovirus Gp157